MNFLSSLPNSYNTQCSNNFSNDFSKPVFQTDFDHGGYNLCRKGNLKSKSLKPCSSIFSEVVQNIAQLSNLPKAEMEHSYKQIRLESVKKNAHLPMSAAKTTRYSKTASINDMTEISELVELIKQTSDQDQSSHEESKEMIADTEKKNDSSYRNLVFSIKIPFPSNNLNSVHKYSKNENNLQFEYPKTSIKEKSKKRKSQTVLSSGRVKRVKRSSSRNEQHTLDHFFIKAD